MLQKLQKQHEVQQQQLEKQIQLLQQQRQEMLLPHRSSGEGILAAPEQPVGSRGSAPGQEPGSGPAAPTELVNGTVSMKPAVSAGRYQTNVLHGGVMLEGWRVSAFLCRSGA